MLVLKSDNAKQILVMDDGSCVSYINDDWELGCLFDNDQISEFYVVKDNTELSKILDESYKYLLLDKRLRILLERDKLRDNSMSFMYFNKEKELNDMLDSLSLEIYEHFQNDNVSELLEQAAKAFKRGRQLLEDNS